MRVLHYINRVVVRRAAARLANILALRPSLRPGPDVSLYPAFLYPEQDGKNDAGKKRHAYVSNDAVRIVVPHGEVWIFPDGHRLLLRRARN